MLENKQVRVDNWGTFFLQRLQTFFNKTDFCDLTLQFDGNVQLKVHRLVMNACTDYFQILEQTCEMVDDVLMMPPDLTPDIILPIVNFMYTGMLEYQNTNYHKIYKAAELMEMPVLTKILDAQKSKIQKTTRPRNVQSGWSASHARKNSPELPATLPGRKLPVWKRKSAPLTTPHQQHTIATSHYSDVKPNNIIDPLLLYDNTPKPTRFEWPEEELTNFPLLETSSFDDISYTTKQILTQDEECRSVSTSFDEVKHLPNLNKRSQTYNISHIDIEEVKNYVKEQKVRSELTDYDLEEEDVDNDLARHQVKRKQEKHPNRSNKRLKFNLNEKENITTKSSPPSGTADVNHTKIISEVLKKYPHLVKKNKNIRLKILAKSPTKTNSPTHVTVSSKTNVPKTEPPVKKKALDEGPWACEKCSTPTDKVEFVLYYLYRKHMQDVHYEQFDSKQCKFCGHKSLKQNMLVYHQFIKHEIKPPASYNFPKCNQCPYIAICESSLNKHKSNHSKHDLQCLECKIAFNNKNSLTSHIQITGHTGKLDKTSFDCQYCTKRLSSDSHLFSHIKSCHRDEGRRDGIVAMDELELDEMNCEDSDKVATKDKAGSKIKILSNVKVPPMRNAKTLKCEEEEKVTASSQKSTNNQIKLQSETDVAASLGLVDIVVLDDNQQYILQSNSQDSSPEYILPDLSSNFNAQNNASMAQTMLSNNSDIASTDELVMVLTDHDYNDGNNEMLSGDNSNIVVLYSHPVEDGQENHQYITSQGNLIATSQGNLITTQGNLVLNSQTGMIELRNANSDEQILSQDESIEMIQREINSHKDLKVEDDNFENDKQSEEITETEISEPQNAELDTNCIKIESADNDNSQNDMFPTNNDDENVTEISRVVDSTDERKMKEIDEKVDDVIIEKVAINSEDSNKITETPMETEDENAENVSEELLDVNKKDVVEETENVTQDEKVNEENNEDVEMVDDGEIKTNGDDTKTISDETKPDCSDVPNDSKEQPAEKSDEMEIDNEPNNTENTSTDANEIIVQETQTENEEARLENENNTQNETDKTDLKEEVSNDNNNKEADAESETMDASVEVVDANNDEIEIKNDNEVTDATDINTVVIDLNNEELDVNNDELDVNNEEADVSNEEIDVSNAEIDVSNAEVDVNNEIDVSNEEVEVVNEEIDTKTEETDDNNIENTETQDADTKDETCNDTKTLETATQQNPSELIEKETSQATKIAILDDWEDTDSQQSEQPDATTKTENTVKKLITDWEEEDDDIKD